MDQAHGEGLRKEPMAIRIKVDRARCSGYALCLEAAPNVFDLDADDIAVIVSGAEKLETERANAEYAAKLCPCQAILIEDV